MDQIKRKAKEVVMKRLNEIQGPGKAPTHGQGQPPSQMPQPIQMKIDTEEDFRKMPYEGKAKYDNELKTLNALKNQTEERNQRPKKMFFEHYDTQEQYRPVIQNNSNPSGRPPNIPPEMYEGITVKAKRPWVYLGTQNLPPVEYQEINQSTFKNISKKNNEPSKKQEPKARRPAQQNQAPATKGHKKGPAQKKQAAEEPQFSQFDMSDEIVDQGQSIFATETINKQTANLKSRMSSMRNSQPSYLGQEYSMSQGTETRNKQAQMFDSGEDEEEGSQMFARGNQGPLQGGKEARGGRKAEEEEQVQEQFSEDDDFE